MDTEMRDVDAVAKEDPVPENAMAKEIERAEEATEALTLQQKKEEDPSHAFPLKTVEEKAPEVHAQVDEAE